MEIINYLSIIIMPVLIAAIVAYGLVMRTPVFDCFVEGAKEGVGTVANILPTLAALFIAITMFRASGTIELLQQLLSPILSLIQFPPELLPLGLLRPVSGSGSLAMVQDIINTHGPDSFVGQAASVMMGSTDTTFYTLAVYFGSVGITQSRYTIKAALLADLTGILASVYITRLLL